MLDQFANPPARYRLAPFWIWSKSPDLSEIDRQVREMHAKGLGGFVIDRRSAPGTSSKELLLLVEHAAETAERLRLQCYQYDEPPPTANLPHTLEIKLRTSAVHCEGRSRALARAPGAADWSLSMKTMKRDVDRLACLGVNFFCPNAFYYTIEGLPPGQPCSQFYQATYWRDYGRFADYAARLSYVLSQGRHNPQAALVRPGSFADPMDRVLIDWLQAYCECLLAEHVDFDIVDERAIAHASIEDDRLVLGEESFELLILPPLRAVAWPTADKIRVFVDEGGKLIGTSVLPVQDACGDRHTDVRESFEIAFEAGGQAHLLDINRPCDLPAALEPALRASIKRCVSVRRNGAECPDIACVHRSSDGLELFLLANFSDDAREARISIRSDGAPHMLNLETGDCSALPNCTQQGSRTVLLHRFEPYGSLVMVFRSEPAFVVVPPVVEHGQEIALSDEWEFVPEQPNCLTLRDWAYGTLMKGGRKLREYTTFFDAAFEPDSLLLVVAESEEIHVGDRLNVYVNDGEVQPTGEWAVDVSFKTSDIAAHARSGKNSVRMVLACKGRTSEAAPRHARAKLLGSFSLGEDGATLLPPVNIVRSGSWTDHGYPYYSGTAAYRQTVFVPEFARGQRIILRAEEPADYVEFVVNGRVVAVRPWAPFEVDITRLVTPGANKIELRVTNSLANMMLGEPRPSGLIGGATVFLA